MRNEIYPIRTGKLKFISQNDERGEPKPKHRMHYQLGASIIKRNSHSDQVSEQRREQYPHSLPLPAGQEHHRDAPLLHGLTLTKPKKKKKNPRVVSTALSLGQLEKSRKQARGATSSHLRAVGFGGADSRTPFPRVPPRSNRTAPTWATTRATHTKKTNRRHHISTASNENPQTGAPRVERHGSRTVSERGSQHAGRRSGADRGRPGGDPYRSGGGGARDWATATAAAADASSGRRRAARGGGGRGGDPFRGVAGRLRMGEAERMVATGSTERRRQKVVDVCALVNLRRPHVLDFPSHGVSFEFNHVYRVFQINVSR